MKIRKPIVILTVVLAASACQKEKIYTPVEFKPVVVDQSILVEVPEGFSEWPRTVFVFDKDNCVSKFDVANEAEMCVKLDVGSGYQVVVLAYDSVENLSVTPTVAGEPAYRYQVKATDFSAPMPRVWYASARNEKDDGELSLSFIPITSTLNIEFESVPQDLDSVTVDLPVSMDTWYPCRQKSEVSQPGTRSMHLVLSPEKMKSKLSMGVFAMLNHDAADSSVLRCQVPVCFYYKDKRKPGVLPFKGRIGEAQICDIFVEDSHETYYDNDFIIRHSRRDINGENEVGGSQPLSLWPIDYDYPVAPDTTEFQMNAGRNLAFQFGSVCFEFHDEHIDFDYGDRSSELQMYADFGFNFYRIPVDEGWCFFSNGEMKPTCREELKKVVDWSLDAGVKVVIDLHWLATSNTFPNSMQEIRFRNCWRQIHELFKDYSPEVLAYELVNEADGMDGYWNSFLANSIGYIRSWGGNEVRRKIVCGCSIYQDISGMSVLELPEDPNLIASFHSYAPVFFCFYGTGFNPQTGFDKYNGPCHYPGRMVTDEELKYMKENEPENYGATIYFRYASNSRESLYNEFLPAFEAGKRLKLPVWIGEYGAAVSGTSKTDRLNYYRDVCSLFRQFGFSYSYWFGLDGEYESGIPDQKVIDAIIGN